jgi:hypothetical protein
MSLKSQKSRSKVHKEEETLIREAVCIPSEATVISGRPPRRTRKNPLPG